MEAWAGGSWPNDARSPSHSQLLDHFGTDPTGCLSFFLSLRDVAPHRAPHCPDVVHIPDAPVLAASAAAAAVLPPR